jgi:hypothetical protein
VLLPGGGAALVEQGGVLFIALISAFVVAFELRRIGGLGVVK